MNARNAHNESSPPYVRKDPLDPLPYTEPWPSLRSATGRVDVHSLAAYWVHESRILGPYLEFGVGTGRSAIAAIRANRRYNAETVRDFFLFDSFEGLPPLRGRDAGSTQFREKDFASSEAEVIENLKNHDAYDPDRIHLIAGYFTNALNAFDLRGHGVHQISIAHIDVDLYQSCIEALDFATPYLQLGSMLLFDDWNAFCASRLKGERAAVSEWLGRNPNLRLNSYASYGWHGKAFLVDLMPPPVSEGGLEPGE